MKQGYIILTTMMMTSLMINGLAYAEEPLKIGVSEECEVVDPYVYYADPNGEWRKPSKKCVVIPELSMPIFDTDGTVLYRSKPNGELWQKLPGGQ
jgi:hypothetical protein